MSLLEEILPETPKVNLALNYAMSMIEVYKMCAAELLRSDFADVIENFRIYFRFAWRLNMVNATVKLHTVYAPWHLGKLSNWWTTPFPSSQ